MIVYIEYPRNIHTTRISEFSKAMWYKVNKQISIVFLYTCNKQLKYENVKIIPFTIVYEVHPWSGKESGQFHSCPHVAEQLSPRTTTAEPGHHNYWSLHVLECAPQQEKPLLWEACAPQLETNLYSWIQEKAHVQHSQK